MNDIEWKFQYRAGCWGLWGKIWLVLWVVAGAWGCSGKQTVQPSETKEVSQVVVEKKKVEPVVTVDQEFVVKLSSPNDVGAKKVARDEVAKVTPLSHTMLTSMLARLPKMLAPSPVSFQVRESTTKPPQKVTPIKVPFPPATQEEVVGVVKGEGLKVLREAPEGDVGVAPFVSVTFNQPMVAVSTLSQVEGKGVPIELTPLPKGEWQWLGSRTAIFKPVGGRMPMSTRYQVKIPVGASSESGEKLAEESTFTFTTKRLTPTLAYPFTWGASLTTPILLSFDQEVDPAEILKSIEVIANHQKMPVELLNPENPNIIQYVEPSLQDLVRTSIKNQKPGHFLLFKTVEKLPPKSEVEVVLKKGAESAEGPLKTEENQSITFHTRADFRVDDVRCGYRKCRPSDAVLITFSNEIEAQSFDHSMITITPEIPDLQYNTLGNSVMLLGMKKANTTYTVEISPKFKDIFGQSLTGDLKFTFKTGETLPYLSDRHSSFSVLNPFDAAQYSVQSTGITKLRFMAWKVAPEDYIDFQSERYLAPILGEKIADMKEPPAPDFDQTVEVSGSPESIERTTVDLKSVLKDGKYGSLVVVVYAPEFIKNEEYRYQTLSNTWLQSTDLGIDQLAGPTKTYIWVNQLTDGKPVEGASVKIGEIEAKTDANGIASFDTSKLREDKNRRHPTKTHQYSNRGDLAIVHKGDDAAVLMMNWPYMETLPELRWVVVDDRQTYRPDETVTVKGWVREITQEPDGTVIFPSDQKLKRGDKIKWVAYASRGSEIGSGNVVLSEYGTFNFAFKLPKTPNLGHAYIDFQTPQDVRNNASHQRTRYGRSSFRHHFQIEEFRTPEYEVTIEDETKVHVAGEKTKLIANAKYYAGGVLADAPTTWNVEIQEGNYTPPGNENFLFGKVRQWWRPFPVDVEGEDGSQATHHIFKGRTDALGQHTLAIELKDQKGTKIVEASVAIQDVNRQTWQAKTSYVSHAALNYVGVKTESSYIEVGKPYRVDFVATDIDGKRLADRVVEMTAERITRHYSFGNLKLIRDEKESCEGRSTLGVASCQFTFKKGGEYEIVATITDDRGRKNVTTITRWAYGDDKSNLTLETDQLILIPDKEEYQPGEVAKILVQSPYQEGEGLFSVVREGIIDKIPFKMTTPGHVFEVKIKENYIPNVIVQATLLSSKLVDPENPDLGKKPAMAQGMVRLGISTSSKRLKVEVTPTPSSVAPQQQSKIAITVKDHAGKPVKDAQLTMFVVDEAILALSPTPIPDLVDKFYTERSENVATASLRSFVTLNLEPFDPTAGERLAVNEAMLMEGEEVMELGEGMKGRKMMAASPMMAEMASAGGNKVLRAAPGAMGGGQGVSAVAFAVRKDFNPLAKFVAAAKTDAGGGAILEVKVPDNLTRYRVLVFATAKEVQEFGHATSKLTASLPLMVRVANPRFLNFEDSFQLPLVLQNQRNEDQRVSVVLRSDRISFSDGEILDGNSVVGGEVVVPANDRVELRFAGKAVSVGEATLQVAAEGVDAKNAQNVVGSDASTVTLPIWTPATSEAFATYGSIEEGATEQGVEKPQEVWPQFGELSISTSSTALAELTDAMIYLTDYNYDWSPGTASATLGMLAVQDFLKAFKVPGLPTDLEIKTNIEKKILEVSKLANQDGGFKLWKNAKDSMPYATVLVVKMLLEGKKAGYKVDENVLKGGINYLYDIRNNTTKLHDNLSKEGLNYLEAAALLVLKDAGEDVGERASNLYETLNFKTEYPETLAWMLEALPGRGSAAGGKGRPAERIDSLLKYVENRITETGDSAQIMTAVSDHNYVLYRSDRVTDAVVLNAVMEKKPTADYIPKLVRGLLKARREGRWGTVTENSFILLSLKRYFERYEKVTPSFKVSSWLGEWFAGSVSFSGRQTDVKTTEIPMATLLTGAEKKNLIIAKEGKGRLYYRIGLNYAPKSFEMKPSDHGFTVLRQYVGLDHAEDAQQDADGTWRIKLGSRVKVVVTTVTPAVRYQVALVDPFPAGFEVLNAALAVSDVPDAGKGGNPTYPTPYLSPWYYTPWNYANLRTERAEVYANYLSGGVYTYEYYVRATTPGRFHVPPAKAEELYSPETFGRSTSETVIIE